MTQTDYHTYVHLTIKIVINTINKTITIYKLNEVTNIIIIHYNIIKLHQINSTTKNTKGNNHSAIERNTN